MLLVWVRIVFYFVLAVDPTRSSVSEVSGRRRECARRLAGE